MTNLLILYPSIPWDAKRIRTTSAFKESQPVDNLIYGERYQHGSLDVSSSWLQTLSFELESNTTQAADYLAFARSDMLAVRQIRLQGSSQSFFTISDVSGITGWWDPDYKTYRDGSDNIFVMPDLTSNGRNFGQTTGANRPQLGYSEINACEAIKMTAGVYLDSTPNVLSNFVTSTALTGWCAFRTGSDVTTTQNVISGLGSHLFLQVRSNIARLGFDSSGIVYLDIAVTANTNYVAAFRLDSGNMYFSLNGGAESSTACGALSDLTRSVWLGGNSSDSLVGRIGEVILCNSVLPVADRNKITNMLVSKWVTPIVYSEYVFPSGSFVGPDSADYAVKFAQSTAYKHWWLSLLPNAVTYLQHSKDYFGSSFDMGTDPDYTFELFQPFPIDETFDSGVKRLARLEKNLYRFNFTWEGVTDSKLTEFITKICNNRDRHRFLLYTQDQHQILDSQRLVHCKLTDAKTRKTWDDFNEITATFEEVPG